MDGLVEPGLHELFKELERGGVVEELRVDPTAARPWGRHNGGDPEAHANGAAAGFVIRHALRNFVGLVGVFERDVDACRGSSGFGTLRIGRDEGR